MRDERVIRVVPGATSDQHGNGGGKWGNRLPDERYCSVFEVREAEG